MKCDSCKNRIEDELKGLTGVKVVDIDVDNQRLLLELNEKSSTVHEIQSLIETKLGITTVIKGIGDSIAAVSEIQGFDDIQGVVRFTQLLNKFCLIDGVIDGLKITNNYSLKIHEFGDLSGQSFERVGPVLLPVIDQFKANDSSYPSRASFKSQVPDCDLSYYIGRALAVSKDNRVIGAGIVARASRVGDNSKKICACSGRTLWDERNIKQENRTSRL
jgi:copper chaperone for superoxide dismutase